MKKVPMSKTTLYYLGKQVDLSGEREVEVSLWGANCVDCQAQFIQTRALPENGIPRIELGKLVRRCPHCRGKGR